MDNRTLSPSSVKSELEEIHIEFHEDFNSPDGDIVLAARDSTLFFRVHSFVLKTTSSWFRAMLSLPQQQKAIDVIYMDEDHVTLELLLRMICGLPVSQITDYDTVDSILFAAEKYEMAGPISILRLLVMTPPLMNNAFRLYTIACRYNWQAEAQLASTQTLTHNLHDPELRPLLRRLSTDALLNLLELHHSRKEALRDRLNKPPFVPSDNISPTQCNACHCSIDYHTWRELKYRIVSEMEVRPAGDSIVNIGLTDWPEAKACWTAKCTNRACNRALYDELPTRDIIRQVIDELPKSL
ncbi:BTB domain-containing protein [Mycena indigotica]|uniref:BTB domain-containing protein n=1 Tax=Mycena indigotica TaxID=2126181 RepID=A0A8H6WK28_9AGAR|nr:BTB domain-containing protein [Mycena indigotica]KAF7315279.1 BTB domain-containing protein [Mycena indigotica]